TVEHVHESGYSSAPRSLITAAGLKHFGLAQARGGWLVESSRPLSAAQATAARQLAAAAGVAAETRNAQPELATTRTVATVAGYLHNLKSLGRVPVGNLVVTIVGIPLLAAAVGWLVAGREPPAVARQPLAP